MTFGLRMVMSSINLEVDVGRKWIEKFIVQTADRKILQRAIFVCSVEVN